MVPRKWKTRNKSTVKSTETRESTTPSPSTGFKKKMEGGKKKSPGRVVEEKTEKNFLRKFEEFKKKKLEEKSKVKKSTVKSSTVPPHQKNKGGKGKKMLPKKGKNLEQIRKDKKKEEESSERRNDREREREREKGIYNLQSKDRKKSTPAEVGISTEDPEQPDSLIEMESSKSRNENESSKFENSKLPEKDKEISTRMVAKSTAETTTKIKARMT